ncbi:MAG TPA: nuclear transport factor 2 family protein [Streptosporangiaceae bacterium]|nr:nuclear transport factor 2 family protein [Streptosporangiaceae bacterium]
MSAVVAPGNGGSFTQTKTVVDALYDAYLRGDPEGMLSLFSDGISLRFLGQVDVKGLAEARRFFAFAAGLLTNVEFRIKRQIIDGEWAAVIWDETAQTPSGEPWANHGIDVIHVENQRITELHENNDTRLVARHFPRYGSGESPRDLVQLLESSWPGASLHAPGQFLSAA